MATEASLTFPLVLLSISFVFTVYLNRQVIKKALQDCQKFFSRSIQRTKRNTRRVVRHSVRRVRQRIARRRQPGQSAEYELLDMSGNTAAVVDVMEREYTFESESNSASIYSTESKDSSLQRDIMISDISSSESPDDEIYSSLASHRLSTRNIHRGTIDAPQITPMAWEIEHARRMQQGGPSTWLHRMVDWTVERVQASFEASNPINEEYASYIRHEEVQEGSFEHVE